MPDDLGDANSTLCCLLRQGKVARQGVGDAQHPGGGGLLDLVAEPVHLLHTSRQELARLGEFAPHPVDPPQQIHRRREDGFLAEPLGHLESLSPVLDRDIRRR
jgi:hypothetical protein